MSKHKTYLGDAVYADFNDFGQIVLTTWDGISGTNEIFLEPEVYAALLAYVTKLEAVRVGRETEEVDA